MFKKLISKKGQVSMEMGILVATAVAVAAIAAYYYTISVRDGSQNAGQTAEDTINTLNETASNFADEIPTSP